MTDDEQVALFLGAGVSDEYRLKTLGFEPDVIYDIGADVGSITMFAHATYPQARIVAVEPNPWSYPRLVENAKEIPQIVPLRAAIGQGQLYEAGPATQPLHWMVVGRDAPSWKPELIPTNVPAVMLDELYVRYGGERYVVKMDCESGEYAALTHEPSCLMIINSAFFAAELHIWAREAKDVPTVADTIWRFFFRLAQTHTLFTKCYGACIHVWAKKRINNSVEGGDGIIE
jgi:FkbM family methyltransferase